MPRTETDSKTKAKAPTDAGKNGPAASSALVKMDKTAANRRGLSVTVTTFVGQRLQILGSDNPERKVVETIIKRALKVLKNSKAAKRALVSMAKSIIDGSRGSKDNQRKPDAEPWKASNTAKEFLTSMNTDFPDVRLDKRGREEVHTSQGARIMHLHEQLIRDMCQSMQPGYPYPDDQYIYAFQLTIAVLREISYFMTSFILGGTFNIDAKMKGDLVWGGKELGGKPAQAWEVQALGGFVEFYADQDQKDVNITRPGSPYLCTGYKPDSTARKITIDYLRLFSKKPGEGVYPVQVEGHTLLRVSLEIEVSVQPKRAALAPLPPPTTPTPRRAPSRPAATVDLNKGATISLEKHVEVTKAPPAHGPSSARGGDTRYAPLVRR